MSGSQETAGRHMSVRNDKGQKVQFSGQVAVVTGAGRGLGRTFSIDLAQRGAAVAVNDISREAADEVVDTIRSSGGEATAVYDSVATQQGGRSIVDAALNEFGAVDIVIANAGIMRNAYFEDITPEMLEAVLDVHVKGAFFVLQAAWTRMREGRYGRVVLMGSAGGMFAMQGASNYATAKGGLYGLGRALAYEGAPHGILVNTVLPRAATSIASADPVPDYARNAGYSDELKKLVETRRTTESVAALVSFLASRECQATGETFSAALGRYARVFVGVTDGWLERDLASVDADAISHHMNEIMDLSHYTVPRNAYDEIRNVGAALGISS